MPLGKGSSLKKVYLAGPDVFKPNAKQIGKDLVKCLADNDLEGLYPLDNEIEFSGDRYQDGKTIFKANIQMIQQADAVLANLEPFRGPSADVGTVWECAYALGLGKIVVCYFHDPNPYFTKVIGKAKHDGMHVEDFDAWDNIMLVHGLYATFNTLIDGVLYLKMTL